MLYFCEECGGKNIVPDVSSQNRIVRFRCQHCQYETIVENKSSAGNDGPAEDDDGKMGKTGVGLRQNPG